MLTPLLLKLAEEASEISHRALKAVNYGLLDIKPGTNKTNEELLAEEICDLEAVLYLLKAECGVVFDCNLDRYWGKIESLRKQIAQTNPPDLGT